MNPAGNTEGQTALIVGNLRAGHSGYIPGGLQAMLPLLASLEQVADAQVELRDVVEVIRAELAGLENRQELPIAQDALGSGADSL